MQKTAISTAPPPGPPPRRGTKGGPVHPVIERDNFHSISKKLTKKAVRSRQKKRSGGKSEDRGDKIDLVDQRRKNSKRATLVSLFRLSNVPPQQHHYRYHHHDPLPPSLIIIIFHPPTQPISLVQYINIVAAARTHTNTQGAPLRGQPSQPASPSPIIISQTSSPK